MILEVEGGDTENINTGCTTQTTETQAHSLRVLPRALSQDNVTFYVIC